ncbi:MAG: hypothetical protein HQK77_10085 [Desulfobacterales bacterium]|nr:hypothetical protein [Desulfobacterales bacterium]
MGNFIKKIIKNQQKQKFNFPAIATQAGLLFTEKVFKKPGIQAYLQYQLQKIMYGWTEDDFNPEETVRNANSVVQLFNTQQKQPNRIAIDGVPGSGKTTLSKTLAKILTMDVVCLDHENMDEPLVFDKDKTIYEHHRLLRTQDVDAFDVLIYIDEPIAFSKAKVLQRKRGAYLIDIMDYDRLKQIGEKAFYAAMGDVFTIPDTFIKVKFKPDTGFRDTEHINTELMEKNLYQENLTKEQSLFLSVTGKPNKGFMSYLNPKAYEQDLFQALLSAFFQGKPRKSSRW